MGPPHLCHLCLHQGHVCRPSTRHPILSHRCTCILHSIHPFGRGHGSAHDKVSVGSLSEMPPNGKGLDPSPSLCIEGKMRRSTFCARLHRSGRKYAMHVQGFHACHSQTVSSLGRRGILPPTSFATIQCHLTYATPWTTHLTHASPTAVAWIASWDPIHTPFTTSRPLGDFGCVSFRSFHRFG